MKRATWLCRAGWPLALGMIMLAGGAVVAQDEPPPGDPPPRREPPPPPGDGPPPPEVHRDRIRALVRHLDAGFQFKMSVAPVPHALDAQLELKGEGVLVSGVGEGGPAEKAGIRVDDILLAAGDKSLKGTADLAQVAKDSAGKELTLKVLRAGKPMTVAVTPQKAEDGVLNVDFGRGVIKLDLTEIHDIERTIREKVRDAGVDLRMQFIEAGTFLPKGANFNFFTLQHSDLPDDLSINIRKQGKQPADVEVKQGDKTWTVKENDLAPLSDEVRKHVEGYLGQRPMRFNVVGAGDTILWSPGPPRPPHEGPGRPGDEHAGPRPPRGPEGPGGPDGPPPPRGDRADREPRDSDGPQARSRLGGSLERRLEEMTRRMEEVHEQLNDLRRHLREDLDRPRRPERPEGPGRPDGPAPPERPDDE